MSKFTTPRGTRFAVGLAVLSVFAAAPMAAQAQTASNNSEVEVTGTGSVALTTAPTFGNFPAAVLDGLDKNVATDVTPWKVTDATGTYAGWDVNIKADLPHTVEVDPADVITMTGATLSLTAPAPDSDGTNESIDPAVEASDNIIGGGVLAAAAAQGAGAGVWNLVHSDDALELTVPADAKVGQYITTITTTLNPEV